MKTSSISKTRTKEKGNALLGIVVIIIVMIVGGVFFWNNYQIEKQHNEDLKKQASTVKTEIIKQPEIIETATGTATTTGTSTNVNGN